MLAYSPNFAFLDKNFLTRSRFYDNSFFGILKFREGAREGNYPSHRLLLPPGRDLVTMQRVMFQTGCSATVSAQTDVCCPTSTSTRWPRHSVNNWRTFCSAWLSSATAGRTSTHSASSATCCWPTAAESISTSASALPAALHHGPVSDVAAPIQSDVTELNRHGLVFDKLANGQSVMHYSRHRLTASVAYVTTLTHASACSPIGQFVKN